MKSLIKSIVALTPYRVLRGAANRFQAFDACFDLLKRLGYEPRFVYSALVCTHNANTRPWTERAFGC